MVRSLSFPNESVKIEACKAVIALKLSEAQPALRALLRERDKGGSLHVACARALGKVGDATALPELLRVKDMNRAKGSSTVEYETAIAWIRLRAEPNATKREENLIATIRTKHPYRIDAVELLASMRSRKAIPDLLALLQRETFWKVRYKAMEAVASIGSELRNEGQEAALRAKILEAFRAIVTGDEPWHDKKEAVKALVVLGYDYAFPIIQRAVREAPQGSGIREVAEEWLEEHSRPRE